MKKLIVLGGGFAGSLIAKRLENKFDITLIDSKDYFEFTPGILRVLIKPSHLKKLQIPHKAYLKKTNIIKADVSEITKNSLKINNKIKVHFDYLCVCLGSNYNLSIKSQNIIQATRASELISCHKKLSDSRNILIIGGGLVGVELAAEISTFYKKNITIVHAKDRLIERNNPKTISYAEKFFKKNNVKIVYDNYIINQKEGVYITDNGRCIKADLAFLCTGIRPNSISFKKSLLDEKGYVIVNEFLQLASCNNIFAAGDINNIPIEKTAQNAANQAKVVIKNIIALENKKLLTKYHHQPTPLVISLGKYNGIFSYKTIVITGLVPALLKYLIEKIEIFKYKIVYSFL